jgi:hypothetical protein
MMMIEFGRVSNFPTYLKQQREEEDREDHETNKKKSMKIM